MTSFARVAEALASWEGSGPVDLLVGEPCFDTPEPLRRALAVAADRSAAAYGPAAGVPELRELLAKSARRQGLETTAREVAITHGAKGALLAVLAALVSPGDEVIVPEPGYPGTSGIARRLGATPVGVPETGAGLHGWSDAVMDRIGDRTRAVIVASPSNPTGSVLPDEEVERLVTACAGMGARLVLDEAYAAFRWDPSSRGAPWISPSCGIVRIRSASKTWAMCGWRVGWVIADERFVDRVVATQAGLLNPPATPPQHALLELGRVPGSFLEEARDDVKRRLDALRTAAASVGLRSAEPGGGFYAWLDARDRVDKEAAGDTVTWCVDRARRDGVAFWPGDDFGCPGWVRAAVPRGDGWREAMGHLTDRLALRG